LGRANTFIDVPSNGDHWRQGAELLDDLGLANVPGIDDELGTSQGDQSFRAQKSVSVGNQTDGRHGAHCLMLPNRWFASHVKRRVPGPDLHSLK
jgi:hypothetical protein